MRVPRPSGGRLRLVVARAPEGRRQTSAGVRAGGVSAAGLVFRAGCSPGASAGG